MRLFFCERWRALLFPRAPVAACFFGRGGSLFGLFLWGGILNSCCITPWSTNQQGMGALDRHRDPQVPFDELESDKKGRIQSRVLSPHHPGQLASFTTPITQLGFWRSYRRRRRGKESTAVADRSVSSVRPSPLERLLHHLALITVCINLHLATWEPMVDDEIVSNSRPAVGAFNDYSRSCLSLLFSRRHVQRPSAGKTALHNEFMQCSGPARQTPVPRRKTAGPSLAMLQ
ncbi:hypothetical protein LZ31DRAFT_331226 [Colletotrichum somersetense]|nr:hypothetical protein LZ31DRAFT_331226 [Colletotrichum somersetense]